MMSDLENMNILQVKNEISELCKSPVAEKMYPITSQWVPVTDVLAVIQRFEKYWKNHKSGCDVEAQAKVISEMLGES